MEKTKPGWGENEKRAALGALQRAIEAVEAGECLAVVCLMMDSEQVHAHYTICRCGKCTIDPIWLGAVKEIAIATGQVALADSLANMSATSERPS